jgi:putative peptide zinc metalloprotease protein
VRAELDRAKENEQNLIILSPSNGWLVVPQAQDLADQWLKHGQVVAYIIQPPIATVRAVVTQDTIGLVRQRTQSVEIRPIGEIGKRYAAAIQREVPAASDELPSLALAKNGGGEIATHPNDQRGTKAFETVFQFDLRAISAPDLGNVGSRVLVRFDHGKEPLARQWYRKARQLFLRKYGV